MKSPCYSGTIWRQFCCMKREFSSICCSTSVNHCLHWFQPCRACPKCFASGNLYRTTGSQNQIGCAPYSVIYDPLCWDCDTQQSQRTDGLFGQSEQAAELP